ncbi:MAG TPA: DinB family protein [Candidatus Limnocylindria bacterium]|nr:DinB family protein [Candidatus Limnocylindria bacterium]
MRGAPHRGRRGARELTTTPLAEIAKRSRVQREWALKLVADLNDEQLAWRPTPTAHSIGWTLWHVARGDDNFQRDLTGRSIWKDGGYGARWGHPDRMNKMEDSAAAAMPLPAKDDLLGYVRAVFAATDAAVATIDEARFGEEIESGFMSGRVAVGASLIAQVGHDARHLGEMEYIKGLIGLPGTVTA